MTPGIDKYLRTFNRKERYWLLRNAVGKKFESLDRAFLNEVEKALSADGSSVEIPDDAWFAIDYHFDWIYGAIFEYSQSITANPDWKSPRSRRIVDGVTHKHDITGDQEDIDLLIAFGRTMIFVEAKFEGGWVKGQISSKRVRYEDLKVFQRDLLEESIDSMIEFHLVLASRGDRKNPEGYGLPWVPLRCEESDFCRVQRCNIEKKPSKDGLYWTIVGGVSEKKQSNGPTSD